MAGRPPWKDALFGDVGGRRGPPPVHPLGAPVNLSKKLGTSHHALAGHVTTSLGGVAGGVNCISNGSGRDPLQPKTPRFELDSFKVLKEMADRYEDAFDETWHGLRLEQTDVDRICVTSLAAPAPRVSAKRNSLVDETPISPSIRRSASRRGAAARGEAKYPGTATERRSG
eukprot:Skav226759  [mRNA]  locus=scaffold8:30050:37087:+ [translate_table: standard]